MTKPRLNKDSLRYLTKDLDSELRRLRLKVEQLEDKVREERRQRHLVERELAFERQQAVYQARRRLNGELR